MLVHREEMGLEFREGVVPDRSWPVPGLFGVGRSVSGVVEWLPWLPPTGYLRFPHRFRRCEYVIGTDGVVQ